MKAYVATVHILIDPRIVGPDAPRWKDETDMAEEMSVILSDNPDILDWAYADVKDVFGLSPISTYTTIDINPDNYEEGEFIGLVEGIQ